MQQSGINWIHIGFVGSLDNLVMSLGSIGRFKQYLLPSFTTNFPELHFMH